MTKGTAAKFFFYFFHRILISHSASTIPKLPPSLPPPPHHSLWGGGGCLVRHFVNPRSLGLENGKKTGQTSFSRRYFVGQKGQNKLEPFHL